jgi:hypothetical protein
MVCWRNLQNDCVAMTDPNFKPAIPNDIETLIAMMRELYAHDGLAFDEAVARRALLGVIGDETFGRVFMILMNVWMRRLA